MKEINTIEKNHNERKENKRGAAQVLYNKFNDKGNVNSNKNMYKNTKDNKKFVVDVNAEKIVTELYKAKK